ncbi:MAG: T9SS type A sorting domain-containing protein [Hymenobacter sp.]|nr:MAG: T9SS type A sorting domain-containing protein [Hymenobacter sp.]
MTPTSTRIDASRRKLRAFGSIICPNSRLVQFLCLGLLLHGTLAHAQPATKPAGSPGLAADYYQGYFYDAPSFFTTTVPAIHNRSVEQLNFQEAETDNFAVGNVAIYYSPGKPDEFSGRFQGQLYITKAGQYTFYLGSDDAAYLWLDNSAGPLVYNKGDMFPFREASGTCNLSAGLHTLRVDYGEHGGSQGLVLQYSGPDMPKQLVPNGVLYNQLIADINPTLTNFEVTPDNQRVNLTWQTAAEENCVAFVIQKSADGMVFTDFQRQPGAATTSVPHSYAAVDQQPVNGWNFYRMEQLRSDRSPVYSPIKAVEIKPEPFVVSVYPVPNDGTFYLQIQPSNVGAAVVELIDMSGRPVYKRTLDPLNGVPQRIILKPAMATGLYLLRLTSEAGNFDKKITIGL